MHQKYFFSFLLILLVSSGFIVAQNEIIPTKNPVGLELKISTPSSILNLSSNPILPDINVSIVNNSRESINIVLPGDGSLGSYRTPTVRWSVIKIEEDSARHPDEELPAVPRNKIECKLVNRMHLEELVALAPNAEIQINDLWVYFYMPKELGKYSVKLYYKNEPNHRWLKGGYHGSILRDLIAQKTDEFLLVSNELIFEIIE